MNERPTGFVAVCRCGNITGAMDFTRISRKDAGKILGEWLFNGCTVVPRFKGSWKGKIKQCECKEKDKMSNKKGMYGERDRILVGKFSIALFDGTEHGGLWIEDTTTDEGGQFSGPNLENAIHDLWNEHF